MTGEQLKAKRVKLGWSQEKLARELDVSNASVARWEQFKDKEIVGSGMLKLALEAIDNKFGRGSFRLHETVTTLDDPKGIMDAWFSYEDREPPEDYGILFFQGWESFTPEQKIDACNDAKRVLDRSLEAAK